MNDLKELKCPHCRKNIEITDYFRSEINNSKDQIEKKLKEKFVDEKLRYEKKINDETSLKNEEIENLKKQVIREKQNNKLQKSQIENEVRNEFILEQDEIVRKIEQNIKNKYELKFKQFQIKENEYKKEIIHLHDKVDGEENRIKGESQEQLIEEWLKQEFPIDKVKEIKKGQAGADTLLQVNDKYQSGIGSILIESKRTKNFSNTWIKKMKGDLKKVKSNVGIVVTKTMPAGKETLHEVDGIWICHYSEYKNLIRVIRKSLIALNNVIKNQDLSSDTKSLIFDYFTGIEFKQIIESILEGFSNLKGSLNREKAAMNKLWSEREANIDQVINCTAAMYGKVKGLSGQSIEDIDILKLTKE